MSSRACAGAASCSGASTTTGPAIRGGEVLTGTEKGDLVALGAVDGAPRWTGKVPGLVRGIGVGENALYISTLKGTVVAYRPDGNFESPANTIASVVHPPRRYRLGRTKRVADWQPTLDDISRALTDLADRITASTTDTLEPYVYQMLRDVAFHLELHIPGLETPADADAAQALARAAQAALDRGAERDALARAVRGLSFSPHDPTSLLSRRLGLLRVRCRGAGAAPALPHAVDPPRPPCRPRRPGIALRLPRRQRRARRLRLPNVFGALSGGNAPKGCARLGAMNLPEAAFR